MGQSQDTAADFCSMDDGEIRWVGEGIPDMQVAVVPREEITFNHGWYVQGLNGTGSYGYGAQDCSFARCARVCRRPRTGLPPATHRGRQEHARRCHGTGGDEIPHERHGGVGQSADIAEGACPPRCGVARRPPAGARGVHHAFISEKVAIDATQVWPGIIADQFGL
jgi:hypothetical protein